MSIAIDQERRFQLWEYHVSHGQALIRSPKSEASSSNIDIMLFGVRYLAMPRHLGVVQLVQPTDAEVTSLNQILGGNVTREQVVVLVTGLHRHLAVAARVIVRESEMEMFNSPFS